MAANDYFRHKLTTPDGRLPVQREMLAGGAAGFCQGRKTLITRLGNLGFFLGKPEILIVALSKNTYQRQRCGVQLPVGA